MVDPFLVGASALGDPILIGVVIGLPTTVLGVLGYRRSVKLDKVAAASAQVMVRSAEVQQVIDGLTATANILRADNEALRAENAALRGSQ